MIWEQSQSGISASIWTVCAGGVPTGPLSPFAIELQKRWQASRDAEVEESRAAGSEMVELRRAEDFASCSLLRANYRHFEIPDCIYRYMESEPGQRTHLYNSRQTLFGSLHPSEAALVDKLRTQLTHSIPEETRLACPLGLGNHVDHQLTRVAAESLERELWYYADFPYTRADAHQLDQLEESGWQFTAFSISPLGLAAWQKSIAAHRSQISSFWPDREAMQREVRDYSESSGGVRLWKPG
ncbi:MAG: hypothetical protein A2Z16_01950 [Chloroflexi bacterium RBG_16_54_18]|nr:MAG: hypothetical protein A2Z16_01950 [Chloroflexi bacterium RBG_16_54_18]